MNGLFRSARHHAISLDRNVIRVHDGRMTPTTTLHLHTGDPATCGRCHTEKAEQRDRNQARGLRPLTRIDLDAAHAEDWHQPCASTDGCTRILCLEADAGEACEHGYCIDEHAATECEACSRQRRADARS